MDEFLNWLASPTGNAVAGWGGLVISVVGFWLTVSAARGSRRAARESKAASERAAEAAQAAVDRIGNLDVFGHLTEVSGLLRDVAWMERETVHPAVKADRYSTIRRQIAQVRAISAGLTNAEKAKLQSVIANCKVITEIHDRSNQTPDEVDAAQILAIVGDMQQEIAEVAGRYRQRMNLTDDNR